MTSSNTPTPSITASNTPTITPSLTSCPYICCLPSGFTTETQIVSNLFLADDNTILIGGNGLGIYSGNTDLSAQILRIDACGNFQQFYNSPGTTGAVSNTGGFAKQSNGKIIVAGNNTLWRLNADYSVDTTFTSGFTDINTSIRGVEVNSQDEILIVGNFNNNYTTSAGTSTFNTNIYKLSPNGIPDTSYSGQSLTWIDPGVEPFDNQIKKDPTNKLMIDGFNAVNGNTNYAGIVRFNDDFSLDTTFNAAGFIGIGRFVYTSRPLINGQYLVGGGFDNYSGFTNQDFLIRLNNNGTLDTTFDFGNTVANQFIYNIVVQSTGKIVIADSGANVIRLNSDGSVDNTFISGSTTTSSVYNETSLMLFPNDAILVGGSFDTYNSLSYPKLVKLDEDGELNMCPLPTPPPTSTPTTTPTPTCFCRKYRLSTSFTSPVFTYTDCDGTIRNIEIGFFSTREICSLDVPTGGSSTFLGCCDIVPTPPPTNSPTRTETPTPSITASQTQTATPTASVDLTPTMTPSNTETPTNTPSQSQTATPSATIDLTPTTTPSNTQTPSMTATPTITPSQSGECSCYCVTYDPDELPNDLYVRYALCGTASVETELINTLAAVDNLDGTYTACICVKQGGAYAIPVCVQGDIEVTCDPYIWVLGGSCANGIDCLPTPPTSTPTETPQETPTNTPSNTSTPSITQTNTSTPTPSPTTSIETCAFLTVRTDASLDVPITGVEVNSVPVTYLSGTTFTIDPTDAPGYFNTTETGATQTVSVTYGANIAGQRIEITDCDSVVQCCDLNPGGGTCTFTGVDLSCNCNWEIQAYDGTC